MSVTNYLENELSKLTVKELQFLEHIIKNNIDTMYNDAHRFGVNVDTILAKLQRQKLNQLN